MKAKVKTIAGQPSWIIASNTVELALTQKAGHLAPVTFYRDGAKAIQPYHITPWQYEKPAPNIDPSEKVLEVLRGDFLCFPFCGGKIGNVQVGGHGQPSFDPWTLASVEKVGTKTVLNATMKMSAPKGKVTKMLALVDGHNVVYNTHTLEGFTGRFPISHHATLRMPEEQFTVNVSTSPFALGETFPVDTNVPAAGTYSSTLYGQKFKALDKVPTLFKNPATADLTAYPRMGYCDIIGVFHKPKGGLPAWTAAVYTKEGFLWFSLKDPAVLPCMNLWAESRGRWNSPWCGRNNCLGLEDGVSYMDTGIDYAVSPNSASKLGIPTFATLSPKKPTAIHYIQGVLKTPKGFDRVAKADFTNGAVTFTSDSGKKATAAVNWEFLFSGQV